MLTVQEKIIPILDKELAVTTYTPSTSVGTAIFYIALGGAPDHYHNNNTDFFAHIWAQKGMRGIVAGLPGHGNSTLSFSHENSHLGLEHLIQYARKTAAHPQEPLFILGHSYSGYVVAQAPLDTYEVNGAVLINPMLRNFYDTITDGYPRIEPVLDVANRFIDSGKLPAAGWRLGYMIADMVFNIHNADPMKQKLDCLHVDDPQHVYQTLVNDLKPIKRFPDVPLWVIATEDDEFIHYPSPEKREEYISSLFSRPSQHLSIHSGKHDLSCDGKVFNTPTVHILADEILNFFRYHTNPHL